MTQLGRAGAYFALFSEIGLVLLVTTLGGVLAGYWLDRQLGTLPILVIVGFLAGAGLGARAMYVMIVRFLARYD
jgi:F0F1-type ATP synthase assembly protein I